jgi:hypothetical protein
VVGVQFKWNGTNFGAEDTTSPYGLTWNTTATANGSGVITAVARDAAGNTKTSTGVTVTVQNSVTISGSHLYVATTGSDTNSGTQSAPFRTITKAGAVALPNTTVHVAPGTYNENVVTNTSGTASGYITYLSDTKWGAKVVAGSASHSSAFKVLGNYTKVIGFDITGGGAVGLDFQRSYGEAHRNTIHDIPAPGNDGFGGAGIAFSEYGYTNGIADSNIVARIGTYVASLGSSGNNKVQGLYASIPNVTFSNNIVYGANAFAINTGHFSINCIMVNNTLFGNGNPSLDSGGVVITATDSGAQSAGHVVRNNIIFDNQGVGIHEEGSQGTNVYSNNLVYQNNTNFGVINGHSNTNNVVANPQFVNYIRTGGGDYHLQSTSPAINTGISTNAPTKDLDGIARPQGAAFDIGAYER